ncbi:MAG: penicillin acylase family protein [Pseudomonadota bacterium]
MMKRILLGVAALVVAVVIAAGVYTWDPLPSHPSAEALSAAASQYDVEIIRDNWGTPHIYGVTNADTAFGVAYAHAEDDYDTIQDVVAATRGVLARYKGAAAAPTDYVVALLDVWGTIDRRYESDVPADVKAIAEAYAMLRRGEAWLIGAHIPEYAQANKQNHPPVRDRAAAIRENAARWGASG